MQKNEKPFIPPGLLALDLLGAVLLGLGIVKHIKGIDVIPMELRFEDYGLTLIWVGIALMAPATIHIVRKVRELTQEKQL